MSDALLLGLPSELALAAARGLLLNLTPCVLPAMPLKVRSVLAHTGVAARKRVTAAAVFAAGTLAFFLVVGLATAMLHWTWGRLFQSSAVLAVLVVVLAVLAMLTYRNTRLPVPGFATRLAGGGYWEPFWSGALVALLATPCTGPFLGGVLAFALTRPPEVVISIFSRWVRGWPHRMSRCCCARNGSNDCRARAPGRLCGASKSASSAPISR
ncbi:cytochrome c biogenesis protein CcdA [Oleiagrimonas sp. MCCC 1A03011]|uniref:cytochrome c biogenesis protein CcdA n=1 Tax=Oleiagrimonas sp. MCCC 1A03011 TaxID=1926883 RepID=UPI000DC3292F|nr:cytochrome c biogenesis protein CcdA [Oleiagrimonas sp. MCCC 1A03011]RAP56094.1 hypothetical protein BTJ49_14735 [Oleiagrimonas sp. MCCC 1A03011]